VVIETRNGVTTMNITATGYIVYTQEAIFGTGETKEAAWADAEQYLDRSAEDEDEDEGGSDDADGPWVQPASAALLAEVADRGGAIAWCTWHGVACTRDEYDAADEAA
jgi:hypothetical protein